MRGWRQTWLDDLHEQCHGKEANDLLAQRKSPVSEETRLSPHPIARPPLYLLTIHHYNGVAKTIVSRNCVCGGDDRLDTNFCTKVHDFPLHQNVIIFFLFYTHMKSVD